MAKVTNFLWEAGIEDGGGSGQNTVERTATERATIVTDVPIEQTNLIWAHPQTPRIGDLRLRGSGRTLPPTYVTDLDLDTEDGQIWQLVVESSNFKPRQPRRNPLNEPARITIRTQSRNGLTTRDAKTGHHVRNSAGEILAPREVKDNDLVIEIRKNIPAVPLPSWLLDYASPPTINTDAVVIKGILWPARTLLCESVEFGEEKVTERILWLTAVLSLSYKRGTWDPSLLHEGLNERWFENQVEGQPPDDLSGEPYLRPILVGDKGELEPTQKPIFLDRRGQAYRDEKGRVRSRLKPKEILTIEDVTDYRALPFRGALPLK